MSRGNCRTRRSSRSRERLVRGKQQRYCANGRDKRPIHSIRHGTHHFVGCRTPQCTLGRASRARKCIINYWLRHSNSGPPAGGGRSPSINRQRCLPACTPWLFRAVRETQDDVSVRLSGPLDTPHDRPVELMRLTEAAFVIVAVVCVVLAMILRSIGTEPLRDRAAVAAGVSASPGLIVPFELAPLFFNARRNHVGDDRAEPGLSDRGG